MKGGDRVLAVRSREVVNVLSCLLFSTRLFSMGRDKGSVSSRLEEGWA